MRSPHLLASLAALVLATALLAGAPRAAPTPQFRVIVNAASPVVALDRRFLTDAFLKKTTRWPSGELIRPVDLSAESDVRRRFSEDVLNRSVSAVKSYWQQLIFSGRAIPPPELDGDDEVIRYVSKYAGAVGYVSGGVALTGGVKVVFVK
jgi:ABC-type phosphate transport system substrate-binding protein